MKTVSVEYLILWLFRVSRIHPNIRRSIDWPHGRILFGIFLYQNLAITLGPHEFKPLISVGIFGFFFLPYVYCYAILKYKVTPGGGTRFFSNDDGGKLDLFFNIFTCMFFSIGIISSIVLPILWVAGIK